MPKYGRKSGKYVDEAMHAHKHQGKYQSDKQAVAVGLSKARKAGVKVPQKDD